MSIHVKHLPADERRAVTVGAGDGAQARILAGVASGDVVVVTGPSHLRDGERVKVKSS